MRKSVSLFVAVCTLTAFGAISGCHSDDSVSDSKPGAGPKDSKAMAGTATPGGEGGKVQSMKPSAQ